MNPSDDVKARADIAEVGLTLGCKVQGERMTAAWRDGDGYTVSIDRERGLFYDHKTGDGGDVFALVMRFGYGFPEALQWLADHCGVELTRPSRNSLRRLEQQRQQSEEAAVSLATFRWEVGQYLRSIRNNILDDFNEAERLYRGPERVGDLPASAWRQLRRRLKLADQIDAYTANLAQFSAGELIALQGRLEGNRAA